MEQPKGDATPALHLQETSRRAFDSVVDCYDARPGYPQALFDVLFERCALRPGSKVLEVGPGTGQVTVPLAQRGVEVTAVELGAAMGARLREATTGLPVRVVIEPLEDVDVTEASFDAVVSATAFHWIDPKVGYPKAARALRDRGWLALWWTLFDDPDRPDRFFGDLEVLLARTAPDVLAMLGGPAGYCRNIDARKSEFSAAGTLAPADVLEFAWDFSHTPSQLRRLFATYSPVMALPEKRRERLLDDIEALARKSPGGVVTRSYTTVMYLAERRSRDVVH
jgi:SAM-dependent methyltransferase